jgi:hypothetical protein
LQLYFIIQTIPIATVVHQHPLIDLRGVSERTQDVFQLVRPGVETTGAEDGETASAQGHVPPGQVQHLVVHQPAALLATLVAGAGQEGDKLLVLGFAAAPLGDQLAAIMRPQLLLAHLKRLGLRQIALVHGRLAVHVERFAAEALLPQFLGHHRAQQLHPQVDFLQSRLRGAVGAGRSLKRAVVVTKGKRSVINFVFFFTKKWVRLGYFFDGLFSYDVEIHYGKK